jgi:hypothetical protein
MNQTDYMESERDAVLASMCDSQHDLKLGYQAGWNAACEAMNAKAHPQPARDWRAACVVRQHENGWGIYSPSGHFWLGLWYTKGMLCKVWKWRGPHKELPLYNINSREVAERDLLTMQCSPPPDWEVDWEAARGT